MGERLQGDAANTLTVFEGAHSRTADRCRSGAAHPEPPSANVLPHPKLAHRLWLSHIFHTGVNFKNFACGPSKLESVRPPLDLVIVVGGTNPTF